MIRSRLRRSDSRRARMFFRSMFRSRMALAAISMGLLLAGCGHQDRIVYGDGGAAEEDRAKGWRASSSAGSRAMEYVYSSTASLNWDIIREEDPSTFLCLHYRGMEHREMWDKRVRQEFFHPVFLSDAYFSDGTRFEIHVNPEFGSDMEAERETFRYVRPLGQLPTRLRRGIGSFGIHDGMPTTSAGGSKIFLYRQNAIKRQVQKHLEESLFYAAANVSLVNDFMDDPLWKAAQEQDGKFLTRHGRNGPERSDIAESALLVWGLLRYPERISKSHRAPIEAAAPNRIAYLRNEVPVSGPIFELPPGKNRPLTLDDMPYGCVYSLGDRSRIHLL